MTPLVALRSVLTNSTSSLRTNLQKTITRHSLFTVISDPSSVLYVSPDRRSSARTSSPPTTWYNKIWVRTAGSRLARASRPRSSKASSVGANTVKGPVPCNALAWFVSVSALTKVGKPVSVAVNTMSDGGTRTLLMMWTTPLDAKLSKLRIRVSPLSLTQKPNRPLSTSISSPLSAFTFPSVKSRRSNSPSTTWYKRTLVKTSVFERRLLIVS
mmetsp:Transcript_6143/g.13778  ORF Transcript_6143/g.13778 Transcript_6143/m.13778 type:complete len:213 (+) Transcript_6143:935-1573(+)